MHVVPNWAYEGDFEPAQADKALADRLGFTGKFNVLYAGIMGPAQGLHNVLDAAGRLSHIKELQFVFLGDGIERPRLQNIAAQRNLRNVTFIDRVPISVMPSVYASVDALLVHLTDDPHFEITIPGKTQSYLASGRPIVVSVAGDATDLVLQARAGIAARPMDPDDLARAVRELWSLAPDRRSGDGRNGRAYYTEHLSPPVLIEKYVQLFQDTCRPGEAARAMIRT